MRVTITRELREPERGNSSREEVGEEDEDEEEDEDDSCFSNGSSLSEERMSARYSCPPFSISPRKRKRLWYTSISSLCWPASSPSPSPPTLLTHRFGIRNFRANSWKSSMAGKIASLPSPWWRWMEWYACDGPLPSSRYPCRWETASSHDARVGTLRDLQQQREGG